MLAGREIRWKLIGSTGCAGGRLDGARGTRDVLVEVGWLLLRECVCAAAGCHRQLRAGSALFGKQQRVMRRRLVLRGLVVSARRYKHTVPSTGDEGNEDNDIPTEPLVILSGVQVAVASSAVRPRALASSSSNAESSAARRESSCRLGDGGGGNVSDRVEHRSFTSSSSSPYDALDELEKLLLENRLASFSATAATGVRLAAGATPVIRTAFD